MRLRATGDIVRFVAIETTFPVNFAHLARCAAAIRARPAAEIPFLPARLLLMPFSADIALVTCWSCVLRRLRSWCS